MSTVNHSGHRFAGTILIPAAVIAFVGMGLWGTFAIASSGEGGDTPPGKTAEEVVRTAPAAGSLVARVTVDAQCAAATLRSMAASYQEQVRWTLELQEPSCAPAAPIVLPTE